DGRLGIEHRDRLDDRVAPGRIAHLERDLVCSRSRKGMRRVLLVRHRLRIRERGRCQEQSAAEGGPSSGHRFVPSYIEINLSSFREASQAKRLALGNSM